MARPGRPRSGCRTTRRMISFAGRRAAEGRRTAAVGRRSTIGGVAPSWCPGGDGHELLGLSQAALGRWGRGRGAAGSLGEESPRQLPTRAAADGGPGAPWVRAWTRWRRMCESRVRQSAINNEGEHATDRGTGTRRRRRQRACRASGGGMRAAESTLRRCPCAFPCVGPDRLSSCCSARSLLEPACARLCRCAASLALCAAHNSGAGPRSISATRPLAAAAVSCPECRRRARLPPTDLPPPPPASVSAASHGRPGRPDLPRVADGGALRGARRQHTPAGPAL